ncbi:hypothetical protein L7F22_034124 [Adiantum nelumboides]|nr:hypothetical protein [Adiantum nelumboides]
MESLTPVVNYILEGDFPKEFTAGQRRKLIKQASTFLWLEGALYQKGKDLVCRRVPSTNEIPKILKGLHEEACGGHFSHELTLKKVLLAGYVWPSMHADVQHWCRSCHNCQVNGNKRLLYGPRQAVIANGPFEKWGIDAMGPLPRTANGKLYILVAIDYMTRWVETQSVAKVNEKTVSKFVYTHICCRFGTPLEIVSDNGAGFRRCLLTEVCEVLKISHRHSTPYYPQSNGLVENANGIIAGIIRKMVESKPKRWDNFLDGAIWAYRTTYRDATQFTPFHLVYGQEALQPIELNISTIKLTGRHEQSNDEAWIDRLLNLVELEWKREAAYHCYEKKALQLKDKLNEGIKDKEIKEKSLVLRYNNDLDNRFDAKFERRWEGPFIVKKAFTGGYYQLMDLNGKEHPRKVNGYRLKPYLSRILPSVFETKQVSKKTKKPTIEQHGSLEESLEVASLVARRGPPQYRRYETDYSVTGGQRPSIKVAQNGFVVVDSTRLWTNQDDTFVFPNQCDQVFYYPMHGDTNWKYVIDVAPRATRVLQSTQELSTIDDVNRILNDNDDDTSEEGGSFSDAKLEYSSTSTDGSASEPENSFLNAFELVTNTDEIDTFSHSSTGLNLEIVLEIDHEDLYADITSIL